MKYFFLYLTILALISSCARKTIQSPIEALKKVDFNEKMVDELGLPNFKEALTKHIAFLETLDARKSTFNFADQSYSKDEYIRGLKFLVSIIEQNSDPTKVENLVKTYFDFYAVYGDEDYSEVLLTSYFEPVINGSLTPTEKFSTPLYFQPQDLVEVDLSQFDDRFNSNSKLLIGRLTEEKSIRGMPKVVPFYNRKEIDVDKKLKNRSLEICYVDPIDAFFLQIQGSGTINLENGETLRVGFISQNGHKYESIGKFLTNVIPLDEINAIKIEAYLKTLKKSELNAILNKNPSYVFFRFLDTEPITSLGNEVFSGRTIATDTKFFPKGALAFLTFDNPSTNPPVPESRFVFDQDTGGAIKGPGRVDLFWGKGDQAKLIAGLFKSKAYLYYLAPKKELLSAMN